MTETTFSMNTYSPDQLREILRLHALWLRGGEGGVRANLAGACLRDADLSEADLREANLCGAKLRWADLRGAILEGAKLQGAVGIPTADALQAAVDAELEACCAYIARRGMPRLAGSLRAERRPPVLSEREQAIKALREQVSRGIFGASGSNLAAMRLALRALEAGNE